MSFLVRRAAPDEVDVVVALLSEAAAWLESRGEPLWEANELSPATLGLEVTAGLYYLAFSGLEAVGVLRLTTDDPLFWPEASKSEAAYVHRLAVRRAWAGGRVSSKMLDWAASEARHLGCAYLRLDCVATRRKLRQLYERYGFRYHSDHRVGPYHVARYELPLG